ncbi:MAG TPA: carbonic anhydrase [Candidatus Anaerobutyricum stercoris]|uniref:carbonic anhydrase n=1 Tax=Candidatus Anaerobutyricum stercoris TaxID=2838457 RepID=A0A9D2EMB8_9FIRM|nr:carbonic anhydrase [Candidatus Anaerobutyricum stercoris]
MEHINVTDCETALNRLMAGNKEYLIAKEGKGNISEEIRILTHEYGQKPYAIVIACSDSRVIPEKIFMVGIGEIFTIRVAGNVIGDFELGSIEYAAGHLGVKLIMVMGHSRCGAVDTAIHNAGHDSIVHITDEIRRAIGTETDPVCCEKMNIRHSMEQIKKSPLLQTSIKDGSLKIVGAYYHTRSGKVEILPEVEI